MQDSIGFGSLKRDNLCDQTVSYLTELILANHLGPGDYLPPEPDLCRRLNVSRGTLREAIRVLEARGFIERRHGVGILVSDRSLEVATQSISLMLHRNPTTVRDLFEVRLALECQAATLAAMRATEAGIAAMADAFDIMRNPASSVDERVSADVDFHLRLAECSQNTALVMLTNLIRTPVFESIREMYSSDKHTEKGIPNHEKVLEAVRGRDPDAAYHAMLEHMNGIREKLEELGMLDSNANSAQLARPIES